jgi:hypothetical protein
VKKILMIAFHFPPVAMGSGHLRTLGFVRNLPALGWEPIVLSANASAYPRVDAANNKLIPDHCSVHRAFALDARRHLGIGGKYPAFLAQPDRWACWWPAAVWQGLQLIRCHRISAIWSTYPIMTAHCIAHTLSRITGLPWVADFRDPVASSVESGNRFSVSSQKRWEQRVLARATRVVFTTPGAMRGYAERFPDSAHAGRLAVIPNGYDETALADLPPAANRQARRRLRLVHSGILYPEGRNPVPFFTALAHLRTAGTLADDSIEIVLRASGSEAVYAEEIRRRDLGGMVTLAPPISNREALHEQADADALLLFQGARYDRQIPAKVYEYLRIGRPIFALVGEGGDTAELLRDTGGAVQVPVDDVAAIERGLAEFIKSLRDGLAPAADESVVRRYSRYQGAASLARLLDEVAG